MKLARNLATALALMVANAAGAQTFPDRAVSIIVPWAAGGGTDTVVRTFAAGFERELGVPVNIVNRPGGNGVAGHTAIAGAQADGYTLGAASPEIAFYKTLGTSDLTPDSIDLFSRLATIPAGVTVRADAPYRTLDDLLKAVRESPKGALMSSGSGVGGSWHIAVGGLLKAAGVEADRVRFVPSTGGAPALQDVVAGGLTMFTGSPIEARSMLDAGRVRTLVLMTEQRSPTFPTVPTTREQNLDWVYANWFALVAPKGVPQDRRSRLFDAAKRAMARDDVRQQLLDRGIQPVWDEPGAFAAYLTEFVARGNAVLKDLGLAKT